MPLTHVRTSHTYLTGALAVIVIAEHLPNKEVHRIDKGDSQTKDGCSKDILVCMLYCESDG